MPPVQHTFGVTGNAPSYPGAGATQMPQNRPIPPNNNPYYQSPVPSPHPGAVEAEAPISPSPMSPAPMYTPPVVPTSSPNPTAQFTYYEPNFQSPQEPVPVYTPYGPNESPDLLAARRELVDVEGQISIETNELNQRLNNPSEIPSAITALQESIPKLYHRKMILIQRIQDLQNPGSYAYQQAQAMTANPNHQTPLMYEETGVIPSRTGIFANLRGNRRAQVRTAACFLVLVFMVGVIIVALALKKKHR